MKKSRSLLLGVAVLAITATAQSQVIYTGPAITQNFDTLNSNTANINNAWTDNSTITGFYTATNGLGSMTSYNTQTGNSSVGNSYSFVTASGDTDVSLGAAGNTTRQYAMRIENGTGLEMVSIDLEYNAQFWRRTTTSKTMTVEYQVFAAGTGSVTGGTYSSISALSYTTPEVGTQALRNGNAPGNNATLSVDNFAVSVDAGEEIWIRFTIPAVGANSSAMAFDDIVFSAVTVPEPSVFSVVFAGLGLLAISARRRHLRVS